MRFYRLSTKLLVWFLSVSLVPLLIYSSFSYIYAVKRLKTEAVQRLTEISEYKLDKFENYFRTKESIIKIISYNPIVFNLMEIYNADVGDGEKIVQMESLRQELKQFLEYYTYDEKLLYDLFLINCNGDIIFTVIDEEDYGENLITGSLKDTQLALTFKKAVSLSSAGISRFEYYKPSNEMAAFMGGPIYKDGELLGVVCIQINSEEIDEMASDYTGLGITGETVIAKQDGLKLRIVAPLRHDPDAALTKIITIGDLKAIPIQIASQAIEGVNEFIDYRGVEVFAVSRYLFYSDWGVVVKMDKKEVFASAQRYKQWMIILGVVTFLTVVVVAFFVSRSISNPIRILHEGTIRFARGDFSGKVDIKQKDEIGLLAQSFNSMGHDLNVSREELTRRTKSLEKANEEIKTFAYIVSHDLRSPLVNLKGFSGELNMHLNLVKSVLPDIINVLSDETKQKIRTSIDDKIPHALYFINTSVDKMDRLVNSILKLSRLGRKKLDLQTIDIDKLVKKCLDAVSFQIKEKGVRVICGKMPEIEADLIAMEQVFSNILTNAVNYLDPDRPGIIEVSYDEDEIETIFHIKDNGRGIAVDEMHKVFEIFRRAGRQSVEGDGMGLAYVKTVVHLHRGEIHCKSTLGEGSVFSFTVSKNIGDEIV